MELPSTKFGYSRLRTSMTVFSQRPWSKKARMVARWMAQGGLLLLLAGLLLIFLQTILASPAEKVKVGVYYEALCGDSRNFMIGQILETYRKVGSIMDLELVPYGKATERQAANGTWIFNCHFGPNECKANLIQTCAINQYWSTQPSDVLHFISCMEKESVPHTVAHSCAQTLGLDYSEIRRCKDSSQGNYLQHQMALKTQALQPPLTFVPWVTIDGVHDSAYHDDYLDNLTHLVCRAYKGEAPKACPT